MDVKTYSIKVTDGFEDYLACNAIMMRLPVVLAQADVVFEDSATWFTECMIITVVIEEILFVLMVLIAILAVEVIGTLYEVLLQAHPRLEVFLTSVTDVVSVRIPFVLSESTPVREYSIAAMTVYHAEFIAD